MPRLIQSPTIVQAAGGTRDTGISIYKEYRNPKFLLGNIAELLGGDRPKIPARRSALPT